MSTPDDEAAIVHSGEVPAGFPQQVHPKRKQPVPELGVHLLGPRMLVSTGRAALALRAVYGYSWGLQIEIAAVRAGFVKQSMADKPEHGLMLSLAASDQELDLRAPHGVSSHGQPGYEAIMAIELITMSYLETLWLAWWWPELDIEPGKVPLTLPPASSLAPAIPMIKAV